MTSQEQFVKLIENYYIHTIKQVENNYKTATNHSDELTLERLFTEITGEKLDQWYCSACSLSNWKRFKKLYDELKNDKQKNKRNNTRRTRSAN